MELRPYQEKAVKAIHAEWQQGHKKTLLVLPTGCHAIGQSVMLSNGLSKKVEDVCNFDLLMGSDGTPRRILKIHKGNKFLYKIIPTKGTSFIVTEDHMLTLWRTNLKSNPKYKSQLPCNKFVDITVSEYITKSKYYKHVHKLIRTKVDVFDNKYQNTIPLIDPYLVGVLLGDGELKYRRINITTQDKAIAKVIYEAADKYGLKIKTYPAGKATTYQFTTGKSGKRNLLKKHLQIIGLYGYGSGDKYVPYEYKTGSKKVRLQVLAGLLDTDGHKTYNCYDYISKSKQLADDVAFIARSLGLAAYTHPCIKTCKSFSGTYYRVSISGDCSIIPCRVPHKICTQRKQNKNVLVTGFTIKPMGIGDYIGFTVDGDNRYLLDDFTITHNCGKTITFAKVAENCVKQGKKVLILAHRDELLTQAQDKIKKATGLQCAKEKAEETSINTWYRIVVGSVQTLMNDKRLHQHDPGEFDTIIVDEAHHCLSKSYQKVLNYFSNADVLGVTATPERNNIQCLGQYFDTLAYEYTLVQAVQDGYLCKIKAQTIPIELDLSQVKMSSGDYSAGMVGTMLDPYLEQIAQKMIEYCKDRKTVVFLPLVSTAKKFKAMLNYYGFNAAEVNGKSKDRKEVLDAFEQGKYNVLCNAMLLTEGWDCPSVDCVIMLRPTKIRSLYCQCIGRGTRLSPQTGKEDLLLLDFLWNTERHELCRPASLICKEKDVADKMTENIAHSGDAIDIKEAEKTAREDVITEREHALAAQLKALKERKRKLIDPLQFEMSLNSEDLASYKPSLIWEMAPVTDAQKRCLESRGILPDDIDCAGRASLIIDKLIKRSNSGLCTPKQINFLSSRGFQNVDKWSFKSANKMISRIRMSGWRIPDGVDIATYVPNEG